MELLTGFGPPFNSTPGQAGQCYKDLNTGDIYKCCQAIDIHTPHFDQAAEYRWKLHIEGDEQADLAETDETKRSFVKNKGSIQPDWNQNDPTQPDYIKNKTHFYKGKETVTLMEEQTVSFSINEGDGLGQAISPVYIDLDIDSTYIVKFDDIEYECAVQQKDDILFIGNGFFVGKEDTHEPFLYGIVGSEQGLWIYFGTEKNHTISVVMSRIGIQKIPKEFIPWNESNFKEPINIINAPNLWTPEEKEKYYNKWREGYTIIIHCNGEEDAGIIISMFYNDIVGLQICTITSDGTLKYWSNAESKWCGSDITVNGLEMTVKDIIDNRHSWPIFSEHFNNVNIGDTIKALLTWNKKDKKPAIFKRSKTNISGVVNETYANLVLNEDKEIILTSSTEGSSKKFALTVDDSGTISATEVTT